MKYYLSKLTDKIGLEKTSWVVMILGFFFMVSLIFLELNLTKGWIALTCIVVIILFAIKDTVKSSIKETTGKRE